jgi:hypothetical protein
MDSALNSFSLGPRSTLKWGTKILDPDENVAFAARMFDVLGSPSQPTAHIVLGSSTAEKAPVFRRDELPTSSFVYVIEINSASEEDNFQLVLSTSHPEVETLCRSSLYVDSTLQLNEIGGTWFRRSDVQPVSFDVAGLLNFLGEKVVPTFGDFCVLLDNGLGRFGSVGNFQRLNSGIFDTSTLEIRAVHESTMQGVQDSSLVTVVDADLADTNIFVEGRYTLIRQTTTDVSFIGDEYQLAGSALPVARCTTKQKYIFMAHQATAEILQNGYNPNTRDCYFLEFPQEVITTILLSIGVNFFDTEQGTDTLRVAYVGGSTIAEVSGKVNTGEFLLKNEPIDLTVGAGLVVEFLSDADVQGQGFSLDISWWDGLPTASPTASPTVGPFTFPPTTLPAAPTDGSPTGSPIIPTSP